MALDVNYPDELLYGRTGFLYSLLFVHKHTDIQIKPDHIKKIIRSILANGVTFSQRTNSPLPITYEWHDKEYVAPAHGVSGILFMLLQCRNFITEEDVNKLIKPSIDALANWRFPVS